MKQLRLTMTSWMLGLVAMALSAATTAAPANFSTTAPVGYWLEMETVIAHSGGTLDGQTTYRLYLNMINETDYLSSCSGDESNPLILESSSGTWYNNEYNAGWNAQGINPAFFTAFPELAYDSFLTIGAEDATAPAAQHPSSVWGEFDATTAFVGGPGFNVVVDGATGGAWFLTFPGVEAADSHAAFAGEDLRVLVAQFTTAGEITGQIQMQVFQQGNQDLEFRDLLPICPIGECGGCTDETALNYDADSLYDDGSCIYEDVEGCTDSFACNYNPVANVDDGSCESESCQWCNDPEACNFEGVGLPWTANPALCEFIEEGACDCEGNVLDAAGVCGGSCTADEDGDGVCDDEDECIGVIDACGVCNGPGAIFECGCADIPEGQCDCDGTMIDAVGVCGGNCAVDADQDGWCDECINTPLEGYALETEVVQVHTEGNLQGFTTYRVYMNCANPADYVATCSGDDMNPLVLASASGSWFNHAMNTAFNASGVNPDTFDMFPNLEFDSYLTIGGEFTGDAQAQSIWGDIDASAEFVGGSSGFNVTVDDATGGAWYLTFPGLGQADSHPGFAGEEGRVLLMQMTTAGPISGQIQVQIFQNGDQSQEIREVFYFDSEFNVTDCDNLDPCDGVIDECGVCNGPGAIFDCGCTVLPVGDCDCDGNQLDALGVCGGDCLEDNDGDGVCDLIAEGCTDLLACNYVDAQEDDGSCEYAELYYDCDGNCLADTDGDGICNQLEIPGCTDAAACNYASEATDEDGSCEYAEVYYDCAGNCLVDADGDGVCDELEIAGCTDAAACNYNADATDNDGTCEYAEAYYDCAGNCLNDADGDGVCDELEVEGCTDEMACNYNPDATNDDGSCEYAEQYYDCDGNCLNDADGDGVCDEFEVDGCTDETACNFNPDATEDDDTCTFPGDACDDGDDTTINDVLNDECECVGEVDGLDETVALTWTLYPSPVRDVLNLRLEGGAWEGDVEVMVLGATGQVLRSERLAGRTQLDVSDLASGIYFLTLRSPAMATITRRFVVAGGE